MLKTQLKNNKRNSPNELDGSEQIGRSASELALYALREA
jgi:hypothetical protein